MIKNLADIEKGLGLEPGSFKTMYEDKEEKEIPLADIEMIKKTDLNTRIENFKNEAKTAEREVTAKELKKKFGLEMEGKDLYKIVDGIVEKTKTSTLEEAKLPVDKKVKELTTDLETVKGTLEKVTREKSDLETTYASREKTRKINHTVLSSLPKDLIIGHEDAAELTLKKASQAGITADLNDEGIVVFKKGDNILKDTNLVPLKSDVVLKEYFTPFVKPVSGGAGGGDGASGAGGTSFESFQKEMLSKGIKEGSPAYNEEIKKRTNDKTLVF